MKPKRIRPIRRARGEDAGQRILGLAARMNLEHVPSRLMEPRDHNELVAGRDALQCTDRPFLDLEPRVRRTLGALPWRDVAIGERGSNDADRSQFHPHLKRGSLKLRLRFSKSLDSCFGSAIGPFSSNDLIALSRSRNTLIVSRAGSTNS